MAEANAKNGVTVKEVIPKGGEIIVGGGEQITHVMRMDWFSLSESKIWSWSNTN